MATTLSTSNTAGGTPQSAPSSSSATGPSPHQSQLAFTIANDTPQLAPSIQLTPDQIEFFRTNGWLSIPNIAPLEEINELRTIYDKFFAERKGFEHGNFLDLVSADPIEEKEKKDNNNTSNEMITPQMLWPSRYGYSLYTTHLYSNSYSVSKQLLGEEEFSFKGDHAIMKPISNKSQSTPWHQDEAYWNENIAYEALGVWIALQPVTIQMGCMQFLSKSHTISNMPMNHRTIGNQSNIHGLEIIDENITKICDSFSASVPLPMGGATFHHCRTLHYTGPNKSNSIRRAYTLSFQGKSRQLNETEKRNYEWNRKKETGRAQRAKASGWDREP